AVEMGLLIDPDADETTHPGQNQPAEDCAEVLAQALGTEPSLEVVQETEEALAKSTHPGVFDPTGLELSKVVGPAELEALQHHRPPAIPNKSICFNPQNRHTTKAQKRELLRRDGWACSTPGCCHRLYLHLHHLVPHSQNGPTIDRNLVGLCSSCHRNVHDGSLRIFLRPDGKLHFTDAEGNSVAEQADLELGQWLDFNIGWDGEEDDSFTIRAHRGEWSIFGEAQASIS
ncbi:MAG: HNH endonuclease, partial [Vulcanimicrobiota bacterium]